MIGFAPRLLLRHRKPMHGLLDLRDRLPRTAALLEQGRAEGLHPGAQLCVVRHGETVVDAAIGEDLPGHAPVPTKRRCGAGGREDRGVRASVSDAAGEGAVQIQS
jgi:hypothetical protein